MKSARLFSKIFQSRIFPAKVIAITMGMWLCTQLADAKNDDFRFAEKVNLALRRTAHNLLIANGDSTTTIEPVKQTDPNTFSVRVENLMTYEKLPDLLQKSLKMQQIDRGYNVSVLKCESEVIQLGYNFEDLNQQGGVPCQSREQQAGCFILQVSFIPETKQEAGSFANWWMLPFGTALAGLGFIVWSRSRPKVSDKPVQEPPQEAPDSRLRFGNSFLDLPAQTLLSGTATHTLTYREAKLLGLFVKNTNQVLERDFILKSVWEDEGVTVGRSVDVFVSRLRKLLSADSTIKIAAVHGIGYKMEVLS